MRDRAFARSEQRSLRMQMLEIGIEVDKGLGRVVDIQIMCEVEWNHIGGRYANGKCIAEDAIVEVCIEIRLGDTGVLMCLFPEPRRRFRQDALNAELADDTGDWRGGINHHARDGGAAKDSATKLVALCAIKDLRRKRGLNRQ